MAITGIGETLKLTPYSELCASYGPDEGEMICDLTPLFFTVDGHLVHKDFLYGIYGKVIEGPSRYDGLICSVMQRCTPFKDWNTVNKDQVNFKVGPTPVRQDDSFDTTYYDYEFFQHPEGTMVDGCPCFLRFGGIELACSPASDKLIE